MKSLRLFRSLLFNHFFNWFECPNRLFCEPDILQGIEYVVHFLLEGTDVAGGSLAKPYPKNSACLSM